MNRKSLLAGLSAAVLNAFILCIFFSFRQQPREKVYTIKLTESEMGATYQCIEASTAAHTLVTQVEKIFQTQYQAQQAQPAADTTKHHK